MQTEESQNPALTDDRDASAEEQQDSSLSWLLDQELAETGDSLFSVALDDDGELELTEAEAMMASRPLVRGSNDTEVLSAFVEEEIVIGSVGDSSDIYSGTAVEQHAAQSESAPDQMIVDHSAQRKMQSNGAASRKVSGDILGLSDEDDMGERHLMIRKAAAPAEPSRLASATSEAAETPAIPAPAETAAALPEEPVNDSPEHTEEPVVSPAVAETDDLELAPIGELAESLEFADALPELPVVPGEELVAVEDQELEIEALTLDGEDQQGEDLAAIDYHLDFENSREDAAAVVTAVTPLLGQVVEALQVQVDRRAAVLALTDTQQLELDCTLATDEATVEQSVADGFVALTAFTDMLPDCITDLDDAAIGAIRVRLSHSDVDGDWNTLLQESFELPCSEQADDIEATLPPIEFQSVASANDELSQPGVDLVIEEHPPADTVFSDAEMQLLGDFEEETDALAQCDDEQNVGDVPFGTTETTGPTEDTVVAFAGIAGEEAATESPFGDLDDWSLSAVTSEGSADSDSEFLGFDEFIDGAMDVEPGMAESVTSDSLFSQGDALVTTESTEAAANEADMEQPPEQLVALAAGESPVTDEAEAAEEPEDIFGGDLDDEFGFDMAANDTDVDALLDSLDIGVESGDVDLVGALAMAEPEGVAGQIAGDAAVAPGTPVYDDNEKAEEAQPADELPAVATSAGPWCIPESIEFSYTSASGAELFADFLDAFIEEGALEVEKLEDAISLWEGDIDSEDAYSPVPRILHTLKGIAKGVGLQRYGTLVHNFETLLEKLERPAQNDSAQYFRIVNAWLDATVRGFEKIEDQRADIESEFPLVDGGQPVVESDPETVETPNDEQRAALRTDDKKVADDGAKALAAQQTIRLSVDAVDHLMNLTNQAQQLGVRSSQGTVRGKMALAELQGRLSSVRSHIARIADRALINVNARGGSQNSELDALEMDQYSELQEAASILREGVEDLSELIQMTSRQNAMVEALLKQQNSVMSSLRSSIQAARVIPVSRLMPGLRRIVRTVGADLGKDVAFRVLHETGKLDRDNYNRCQVILEHMVRNALDHGIEDAGSRRAAGKSETGQITVDVGKDGGDYLIRLADDGRGMDPAVIRETAYRKGLDLDLESMSDDEVLRLIFHNGFSTAASVSEVSGRGVGMEIVLSELQAIGGSIDIESTIGEGSTFTIRIPSNVTANGALLVSAGEHSYAIPLDGLVAVEHVPAEAFFGAIGSNEPLELFSLQCEPAYLATLCHGEKMPDRKSWTSTIPVIVAGDGDHYMAIAIDDVEQALELVIRTLGSQFGKVPGLAGGATTADGRAIVALDLNALVGSLAARGANRVAMAEEQQDDMLVMVVDDSRTQRLVATSKFDSLGVETVTAENGMAAIDLLNASHRLPDVILLDVEMPVKDGIQTLKELRKSPRYVDIPVIMVTSRTGAKHRKMAAEAGCDGYMGKPFNFPLLVQDINKLTGRKLSLA